MGNSLATLVLQQQAVVSQQHTKLPSEPSGDPGAAALAEDATSPGSRVFVGLSSPGGRCAWSR